MLAHNVVHAVRALPPARLTGCEQEVLQWIAQGKSNAVIAQILGISERTVDKHVEHILEKLRVENRHAAMKEVLQSPLK